MSRQDAPQSSANSLPSVQQLLVPVFNFFVAHEYVTSDRCATHVADQFELTADQRSDCGRGHEPKVNKRTEFVFNILSGGGVIEQLGKLHSRGQYRITSRGKKLATEKEGYIKDHLTELYRAYYASRPPEFYDL